MSFQEKVWTNLEYLGAKITKCLITGALKYLSEAAESWHNRKRLISYGMSAFIFNGENKSFNLPIVFFM